MRLEGLVEGREELRALVELDDLLGPGGDGLSRVKSTVSRCRCAESKDERAYIGSEAELLVDGGGRGRGTVTVSDGDVLV